MAIPPELIPIPGHFFCPILHEVFEDKKCLILVMEECRGGDETNEIAASAPSMPTTTIDIAHGASHERER